MGMRDDMFNSLVARLMAQPGMQAGMQSAMQSGMQQMGAPMGAPPQSMAGQIDPLMERLMANPMPGRVLNPGMNFFGPMIGIRPNQR